MPAFSGDCCRGCSSRAGELLRSADTRRTPPTCAGLPWKSVTRISKMPCMSFAIIVRMTDVDMDCKQSCVKFMHDSLVPGINARSVCETYWPCGACYTCLQHPSCCFRGCSLYPIRATVCIQALTLAEGQRCRAVTGASKGHGADLAREQDGRCD